MLHAITTSMFTVCSAIAKHMVFAVHSSFAEQSIYAGAVQPSWCTCFDVYVVNVLVWSDILLSAPISQVLDTPGALYTYAGFFS